MVVMELQYSDRASLSTMEEEEVLEKEKEATKGVDENPSLPPTMYRAKGEGGHSLGPSSKEGCGQGRSPSSPRHLGGAFPL